jgi:hypothetical protein
MKLRVSRASRHTLDTAFLEFECELTGSSWGRLVTLICGGAAHVCIVLRLPDDNARAMGLLAVVLVGPATGWRGGLRLRRVCGCREAASSGCSNTGVGGF